MIKVLVAPNSMKGSLNAFDFADTVETAFLNISDQFEIRKVPVADGGDFTGEILKRNLNARDIFVQVKGPRGEVVKSKYALTNKVAIIEMADASGMKLIDSGLLNPMEASSYGTGQLIKHAIENGCTEIFLAIGGSATVDGGMGMLEALGFRFFDKNGGQLNGNGKNLLKISLLETPEIPEISFEIICDVDNPLLGSSGAAAVFGPQKGATPKMVHLLEKGLMNWADIIFKKSGKQLKEVNGGGAAGGISIPLLAFFDAQIVPGADFVLEQLDFESEVNWADIVITGEGKIDSQTLNNKAPFAVGKIAREQNKPVFAIGGMVEKEASKLFDGIYSLINGPMDLEYAIKNSKVLVYDFSFEFAKTLSVLAQTYRK